MRVRPGLSEKRLLAASGALNGLPGTKHRREALWQAELPFHDDLFACSVREKEADYQVFTPLPAMTAEELLDADLDCQGATTGPHPMALWRRRMEDGGHAVMESGPPTASALGAFDHGTPVNIAGLVICRQRPSTAKGHCFITMEDETGIANWFVPKKTFELYRQTITTHAYLLARGRVQIAEGGQATVFVTGLEALPGTAGFSAPHSHDFH